MSKDIKLELEKVENKLSELTSELGSVCGKFDLLSSQLNPAKKNLENLQYKKELYKKSVELLSIVQQVTRENIKKGFDSIVTYALQYILSNDKYALNLEFGRRGNLQEADFNLVTPNCKEAYDPLDSSGGGILDVLSLALRISLLELTKPKIEGFLALDEPFKHLSSQYLANAGQFLKTISNRIGRQIIMVTHKKELVETADNPIEVK